MIGLFGGSFNPVHEGHVALVRAALTELGLKRVIIMPTKNPPHKPGAFEFSDEDRLAMVRLAFEGMGGVEVSDHELRGEGYQYTFNTVNWLRGPNGPVPDGDLALLLGADSFLGIESWHRWEDLLALVTPVVGLRPGCDQTAVIDLSARLQGRGIEVILMKTALPDVSATAIRQALGAGTAPSSIKSIEDWGSLPPLIPRPVIAYLKKTWARAKADK